MNNYAVIMAGGVGTRFWPKGTSRYPKQFLKIADDNKSMLQQTFARIDGVIHRQRIFVVTNTLYRNEVKKQLPIPEENIICEPFGRNTAPCIGLSCIFIKQSDPKANVLVLASDHIINDTNEFHRVIKCGLKFVNDNGGIVTLGINPTHPDTGYGYIQFDPDKNHSVETDSTDEDCSNERIYKVKTFAEKPNKELAEAFLESGDFLWNSGMFIFRVDTMTDEIAKTLPELSSSLAELEERLLDNDFNRTLEGIYSQLKGISIDYGVMERSSVVYTIKSKFGWNDVGSWDEIYNLSEKDSKGNVRKGKLVTIDSVNNLVINEQSTTALIGVENMLIINTDNGLLICRKGESQKVREIVDYLRKKDSAL
jgi:mannose-1-phosphate guanylyltransferase